MEEIQLRAIAEQNVDTKVNQKQIVVTKGAATTESLAAVTARILAQETTPRHKVFTLDFMVSITSIPLIELALGNAIFSPVYKNLFDPSHAFYSKICHRQSESLV
ncbi:hypothetical protein VNO77_38840 [Canavalia gladiata]|uniref:Uncharacterized protein n=1 Tax=Canavalia gladiata TaxID=3824 RepID=A0AAN9K9Y4_CANGL